MKLSSVYSNKEAIFPDIVFNEGFNVVFARVESPTEKEKDSHNLGKTFLISVIDFGLLANVDKSHPFNEHPTLFSNFTFYLEIETNNGLFVTVKRKVKGTKAINIDVSNERNRRLTELPDEKWKHKNLGVDSARSALNDLVNLTAIEPYEYRKGLGYVLRRQSDYDEVFRISKFQRGADKDWKPFMATLLGLNYELVRDKYELDARINKLEQLRDLHEEEAGSKRDEYDEVRGEIEIKSTALEKLRANLERFSFQEIETEINETVVYEIEAELSTLNERRYIIDYEIQEIQHSLETEFEFDVSKIEAIFEEAQLVFPENLKRNYDELIEFNRKLSSGRIDRLKKLSQRLSNERTEIQKRIGILDQQRQSAMELLREQETLEKFKLLQKRLNNEERELIELKQRLERLSRASSIQLEINEEKKNLDNTVEEIDKSVKADNPMYSLIRQTFNEYVERVLNVQALLSVKVNQQGNLEFNAKILDQGSSNKETSEGRGTSYRKIMCACFDLALLTAHASESFYRFVYHDGIFEGLDNRKKVNLLELVREICETTKIQYTLTVIDSDLPRNSVDQKLLFNEDEVIRQLHDKGDEGRLFRMSAF